MNLSIDVFFKRIADQIRNILIFYFINDEMISICQISHVSRTCIGLQPYTVIFLSALLNMASCKDGRNTKMMPDEQESKILSKPAGHLVNL